jgi:hypothetical protein
MKPILKPTAFEEAVFIGLLALLVLGCAAIAIAIMIALGTPL